MSFASIPEAIEDFRAGKMLVVVDDEDRENEGDLTVAAMRRSPSTRSNGFIYDRVSDRNSINSDFVISGSPSDG